jgi:hypothetical protein
VIEYDDSMIYKLIFFDESYRELVLHFEKGLACDFGKVETLIMEIIGYKKNEGDMNKAPKKTDGASYQWDLTRNSSFGNQYLTQSSSFMKNSYFRGSQRRNSGTGYNGVGSGCYKKGSAEKRNPVLSFASSVLSHGLNPVQIGPK